MSSISIGTTSGQSRFLLIAIGLLGLVPAGCERRERVLDVKTPGGGITVDRVEGLDNDDDRVEVNVDD